MAKDCGTTMSYAIGGYFELELRKGEHVHKDAIRLNSARNCFEYILEARKYSKVFIPYFTCDVMLQPLEKMHVEYEFYSIDERLEPVRAIELKKNEAFLYTNYFGLKQDCVERLANVYGSRLIVDNAQAFFAPRIAGIDTFYSPRKFFGVPDGGYLFTDAILARKFERDKSAERFAHLINRIESGAESAYRLFRQADDSLDNQPIRKMSELTEKILEGVDYESIRTVRKQNYSILSATLSECNKLQLELSEDAVPMVYPFYSDDGSLRKRLIENKVFVAKYWPNILEWCNQKQLEYDLAERIIPLPIDQRYGVQVMEYICKLIR